MTLRRGTWQQFAHSRPSLLSVPFKSTRTLVAPSRAIRNIAAKFGFSKLRPRSEPRTFPLEGFQAISEDQSVEEETIPEYNSDYFYPTKLGGVLNGRYQTVAKLGYGSSSTIWLARDLRQVIYLPAHFIVVR